MKTIITLDEKNLDKLNMSKEDIDKKIEVRKLLTKTFRGYVEKIFLLENPKIKEKVIINNLELALSSKFVVEFDKKDNLFYIKKDDNYIGSFNFGLLSQFNVNDEKQNKLVIWDLEQKDELFMDVLQVVFITLETFMEDLYFLATDCWEEYLVDNCGFEKTSLKPYKYGWYDAYFYKKPWDKFVAVVEEK